VAYRRTAPNDVHLSSDTKRRRTRKNGTHPSSSNRSRSNSATSTKADEHHAFSDHGNTEADVSDEDMAESAVQTNKNLHRRFTHQPRNSTAKKTSESTKTTPLGWPSSRPEAPPISIERPQEALKIKDLIAAINLGREHTVAVTLHSNSISIQCYGLNDHAAVQTYLEDIQLGYHAYTPWSIRQHRMVLEEAPTFLSDLEITTALASQGLQVEQLVRLTRKDNTPSDNIMIGFRNGTLLQAVFAVRYIENVKISWRNFRKSGSKVLQCGRCFRFNHVQQNCRHAAICKDCGKSHSVTDNCPPSLLYCVTCSQEGHLAQDKTCPRYIAAVERKQHTLQAAQQASATRHGPRTQGPLGRPSRSASRPSKATPTPRLDSPQFPALPHVRRWANPNGIAGSLPPRRDEQPTLPAPDTLTPPTSSPRGEEGPEPGAAAFSSSPRQTALAPGSNPPQTRLLRPPQRITPEERRQITLGLQDTLKTVYDRPDLLKPEISPGKWLALTTTLFAAIAQAQDNHSAIRLLTRFSLTIFDFDHA